MKNWHYFSVLLLAVVSALLTVVLIVLGEKNQNLQTKLQIQQQILNQGILGQQAQQISAGVLKDLADAAVDDQELRQLLEKHGYRVQLPMPRDGAMNLQDKKQEESTQTVAPEL